MYSTLRYWDRISVRLSVCLQRAWAASEQMIYLHRLLGHGFASVAKKRRENIRNRFFVGGS